MRLNRQLAIGWYARIAMTWGPVSGRIAASSRKHAWIRGRTPAKGRGIQVWALLVDRARPYDALERWAA